MYWLSVLQSEELQSSLPTSPSKALTMTRTNVTEEIHNDTQREVLKAAAMLSHSLEASLVAVELHLYLVQFLDLLVVTLRLVAHQRAVEVNGEHHKNHPHWDHDDGGCQRSLPAAVPRHGWGCRGRGAGSGRCGAAGGYLSGPAGVYGQELDPAEEHHLG